MTDPHSAGPRALSGITLQINLSAGDAGYAALTVPALLASHDPTYHRLLVVDGCRPQRTRIFDPNIRVPEPGFGERLARVRQMASDWLGAGLVHEVAFLTPGDSRFGGFARRYTRPWMTETHDYGGCAYMGYWAALDLPRTRYVLHYDADMLLHQDPGFSWVDEALAHWAETPQALAAIPRISPPGFALSPESDGPSSHEGRPGLRTPAGWLSDWFSTRCFLFDCERLAPLLPLVRGRRALAFRLRRMIDRGYPPGPEHLLFGSLGGRGWRCLNLASTQAYLLHPTRKDAEYYRLLPGILAATAEGRCPLDQRGRADLCLEAWAHYLDRPGP
jgi:hypothetical protein